MTRKGMERRGKGKTALLRMDRCTKRDHSKMLGDTKTKRKR